jgi:hypothetical protein
MLIIFSDIRGFAHKELISSWHSKQPIPHISMMLYGDCMKMCKDFFPNFGDRTNSLLHYDSAPSHTSFFTSEFLNKNNMPVTPIHPTHPTWPPATFCFPN